MAIPENPEPPAVTAGHALGHPMVSLPGTPVPSSVGHLGAPVSGAPGAPTANVPAVAHPGTTMSAGGGIAAAAGTGPAGGTHIGIPGSGAAAATGHSIGTGSGSGPGPQPGPIMASNLIRRVNLRRTPYTVDPLGTAGKALGPPLNSFRIAAMGKVFGGLQQLQGHIGAIQQILQQPKMPAHLVGVLEEPDGSAAARVQVQFNPTSVGGKGPTKVVLTDDSGTFQLNMPAGALIPAEGLNLTVHGSNGNATVNVPPESIAANGMIGTVTLSKVIYPIPVSIVTALMALTPVSTTPVKPTPAVPKKKHTVTIGETGAACMQSFAADDRTDRFPWSLFFRLIEPQMSITSTAQEVPIGPGKFGWMPIFATEKVAGVVTSKQVDRVPVDQPVSLDGFREQVAGIDSSGTFTEDETVPMAASLGLGYILRMSQQWSFQGLGLGDLVYSLPLAPGEQQQVAVFERKDTTSVQETESFSQEEQSAQSAMSDTSTTATFNSAFNEMVNGSSSFSTNSGSQSSGNTYGGGGGLSFGYGPIAIGGGASASSSNSQGSSWSSGGTSSALSGSRDTTALATQATHSSAENQASARVNANRTGMRLATASENLSVTTKTITNHNHNHALTMQYWQVLRMYDVTTVIEGATLVCLIPMQMVRFMPPGQPVMLSDPSVIDSHQKVLARYENILRHMDILQTVIPRTLRHGLDLLAQFAADPTTVVDSSGASAETVIKFVLQGTFLSCETVSLVALTKRNTRVGPVRLGPSVAGQPDPIPADTFMSRDELVAWLNAHRQGTFTEIQGSLALPPSLNRSDIVGFEISRQFATIHYTLTSAAKQAAEQLISQEQHGQAPAFGSFFQMVTNGVLNATPTITLGPGDLEPLLGGPTLNHFYAAVENFNKAGNDQPLPQETYANDNLAGTVLPPQPFPVPALQIAPVLRYQDVLEIEKTAQHVVRNTTRYSRALWMSMTPEESAILLDGYTIGVPPGGLDDASQMIPLMNCLQNKILGTFGNSLIMPFSIPQELADVMKINPAGLQESLVAYQQEAFVAPHSTIGLPTRGVLGEAVLGNCASAEKIDLTRFWNWQDAPADTAPGIGMVQLPTTTPPLTTGMTAPNSLTNLPPLINNLITAPQPNTGLLQAMGQQAASQQDFSPNFTGQQQLATLMQNGQTMANTARSEALTASQAVTTKAMDTVSSLVNAAIQLANQNPLNNSGSQPGGQPAGDKTGGTKGTTSGGKTPAGATPAGSATGTAAPGGTAAGSGTAAGASNAVPAATDVAPVVAEVAPVAGA